MIETLKHLKTWLVKDNNNKLTSIESPENDDGANVVDSHIGYNDSYIMSSTLSFGAGHSVNDSRKLINTYRELINHHEVDNAVEEIVGDAIVNENDKDTVELDLTKTKFSESIKTKIKEEFTSILNLYDFNNKGSELFKRWYVDSKLCYEKIIDENNKKAGIIELRRLDPRRLELVRVVKKGLEDGKTVVLGYDEYFIYDQNSKSNSNFNYSGFGTQSKIEIPREAIVYAHSGLVDCDGKTIIGYLHRAVKPANMLKLLEDAMMVNRISRAPERRVFYVDTGNMPAKRAEEYMTRIMNRFKNKVVYDSSTGKIKNSKNMMSMTDDYWLQRRDGKSVTEVQPLPGATNLDQIEDVVWFNRKLYEALRVPTTRLSSQDNSGVMFNSGQEITRDELKFNKFIDKLRKQFSDLLLDPLKSNLILKGIITKEELNENERSFIVSFLNDSYFEESKDIEILERRINTIDRMGDIVGKYISHEYVMRNILKMSDDDIKEESERIEKESKIERFNKEEDGGW